MDLVVRNARLAAALPGELVDIGVVAGRIAAIEPRLAAEGNSFDAAGPMRGGAVTVLPATDLYLMGRNVDHAVPRGVADAHALLAHGVNCSLSSNSILNPATPFGDCSLLRVANLQPNVLQQLGTPEALRDCFDMLTERWSRLLNLRDYGIAVGNQADLVVLDAITPEAAVAEIRRSVAVFKNGRMTVEWPPPVPLRDGPRANNPH